MSTWAIVTDEDGPLYLNLDEVVLMQEHESDDGLPTKIVLRENGYTNELWVAEKPRDILQPPRTRPPHDAAVQAVADDDRPSWAHPTPV